MFRILTILLLLSAMSGIVPLLAQDLNDNYEEKSRGADGDTAMIKGLLLKEQMYHSNGTPIPGKYEYFLDADGESMLLKLENSDVTPATLEPFVGKKTKIFGVIWDGPLDSDIPGAITRVGLYMIVIRIDK